jgi:hypothetical protein
MSHERKLTLRCKGKKMNENKKENAKFASSKPVKLTDLIDYQDGSVIRHIFEKSMKICLE